MKKILILHSDVPADAGEDELDCLTQARTIGEAIISLGHRPEKLSFGMDLQANISRIREHQPDIVFNLVETLAGKGSLNHFATALLDFLRLPYTGCRTDAMFVTSNKPLAKKMLRQAGIATPDWITLEDETESPSPGEVYFLKPCREDASVGLDDRAVVQMQNPQTIRDTLRERQDALGLDCFAEAYIDGREFNIALLASDQGVRVLPPAEILFLDYPPDKRKVLDYRAKWVEDSFEYSHTVRSLSIAPQDERLADRLRDIALSCWHLFGLRGYARVDFRVDGNGIPWVLEVNANPCLSPDAGFAAALDFAGIEYTGAIDAILRDALKP
ncbi:MAG TPA: ATP-grasp domain-containing protein [Smithellaceae bacterium]|jgi:D-alanine-D-alanine ligase|nr:ATP-grasp domain-containing protein [Syntrophaceae bacterium]HNV56157.1 ATP-grasp domain-containing protein [Smithellaceae bacterium]HPV72010.1 ATP-grasp domain-containing protein [Smithellaceae bacterium]HPY06440.1 ATP-grasp domain-containing protein [Smithellaceae bacterium]HQC09966.1 ATP-grasp domain-containing protein [Smithellaceae bacterium]